MFQPGLVIKGTYQVERLLGSGGMADVYAVSHTRLPRRFALKVLHVQLGDRRDFLDRFRREAEILATLHHPHIVDVVDWDYTFDGQPYLVMEYLEGETLASMLHREGPLAEAHALQLLLQLGEGLQAAHSAGVVHRDLKPNNIYLVQRGAQAQFIKILDFGIAKLTRDASTPLTAQASVMGTPGYMAPEQALGRADQVDPRADQFSLAVILYEMLTGKPAFYRRGEAMYATMERVVHEEPEPLPDSAVARAIRRALHKHPDGRFPTLQEFLAAACSTTVDALPPLETPALPSTFSDGITHGELRATSRWQRPLLGSVLVLGMATAGWVMFHRMPRNHQPQAVAASSTTAAPLTTAAPFPAAPALVHPPSPPANVPVVEALPTATALALEPAALASKKPRAARSAESDPPSRLPVRRNQPTTMREYVMSTVTPQQARILKLCCEKELRELAGLGNKTIVLQRSGALQVVSAPQSVHRSGLTNCLRQAFESSQTPLPKEASIRVQEK